MIASRNRLWPIGAAVFLASAALALLHSDYRFDGTWVLQVIARMHDGDVLYRDVFAGVPPLTFAIGFGATAIFGTELAVLKVLIAATIALSWVAGARILRRFTGSSKFDVPLAIAVIACGQPEIASFYQPLANVFLLLSIDAATAGNPIRDSFSLSRRAWLVGLWCGLAFLTKHTIGAYALTASAAVLIATAERPRNWSRDARMIFATGIMCAVTVTMGMLPVVVSGGWRSFVDYAFLGKGTYLAIGGVPYFDELGALARSLTSFSRGWSVHVAKSLALLVPPVAVMAAVVVARYRRAVPETAVVAGALVVAELAGLYPRADLAHVIPIVPGLLVAIVLAWHVLVSQSVARVWLRTAATLIIAADIGIRFAAAGAALADPDRITSTVPHLGRLVIPRAQVDVAAAAARRLQDAAGGAPLFLLVPDAGFYYLISGIRNPTPFDYPLKPAFGSTGMADTIERLAHGDLSRVCMKPLAGLMAPDALQTYIQTHMTQGEDLGTCILYRR